MVRLFQLTKGQEKAKQEILATCKNPSRKDDAKFHLLFGAAGTGKSTLIQDIINSLPKGSKIGFTSPTHKAAKVLRKMAFNAGISHLVDIRTIHSALGLKLERKYGEEIITKPKFAVETVYDYLWIDEGSMLGDDLLEYIIDCKSNKVIFVADIAQIGPIIKEMDNDGDYHIDGVNEAPVSKIFSEVQHQSELTEIMRQANDSPIISLATKFRLSQNNIQTGFPSIENDLDKNGNGIAVIPFDDWTSELVEKFKSTEFKNNPDFCRVVCYTNSAVDQVNNFVRSHIHGDDCAEYVEDEIIVAQESGGTPDSYKNAEEFIVVSSEKMYDDEFHVQVIELVIKSLDDDRFHTVRTVAKEHKGEFESHIQRLADRARQAGKVGGKAYWKDFWVAKDKFKSFKYVYALTAHKSQGSTFTYTFIYSSDFVRFGCNLNILRLLYTATTRSELKTSFSLE
jgi:exodeoxyribonuclease-5